MKNKWLQQHISRMGRDIREGKTRRRRVDSVRRIKVSEAELRTEVRARGWRVAQIGDDFVFAPGNYTIRPIV